MKNFVKGDAEIGDIDKILEISRTIEHTTICALGAASAWPIQGLIKNFRPHMEERIRKYQAKTLLEEQRIFPQLDGTNLYQRQEITE